MAKNGPPKITCSECGEIVLKSTTRSIGDGKRACKFHDGVMDTAKKVQEQTKKAEKEKNRLRKNFQQPRDSSDDMIKAELWSNYTCWCCNAKGVQFRLMFQKQLVAMEKMELRGIRLFSKEWLVEMDKEVKLPDDLVYLNRFPLPENASEKSKWLNMLHRKDVVSKRQVVELVKFMQLCPDCAKKFGLEFMPKQPTPTLKQLANIGAVYDTMVKPKVREQAAKELIMEEIPD